VRGGNGVDETMSVLLTLALLAPGASAEPVAFVEAFHCGSRGCAWLINVSPDGLVTVEIPSAPHAGRRYRLSPREFAEFKARLGRDRPMELSGGLGDLMVDGPVRSVRMSQDSRTTSFRIHRTPPGFAQLYQTDGSALARALRVCEALRNLGGPELASCVDAR
jgi:hypothetical protein